MMGRNPQKGSESIARIHQINRKANVNFEKIDLANLSSIKAFASRMILKGQPIDLLINNAGVMTPLSESKQQMDLSCNSARTISVTLH